MSRKGLLVVVFVVLGAAAAQIAGAHNGPPSIANPGFEADGQPVSTPAGWHDLGVASASKTEAGGHSGGFQLTHWSDKPYVVTTTQTVRGLDNGWYALSAWVRSSTGRNLSAVSLHCGGAPVSTQLPALSRMLRGTSC